MENPEASIQYINLDRVPERRDFMEAQFARAGVSGALRVSAVDASQPGALDGQGYVAGSGSRWGLTQSEIACFESHRLIWRHALRQDLPAIAIFEDDVELSTSAGEIISDLLQHADKFDMVKLDYSPRAMRFAALQQIGTTPVRPMLEMAPSSAAYVVSQDACRKLLSWSERYSDHLDDFISMPRPDWKMFQCFPAIGVQMIWSARHSEAAASVATSERTQDTKTNSGLDKGPQWFRIRRELQAARRKLYWRSGGQARLIQRGGYAGHIPCVPDLSV